MSVCRRDWRVKPCANIELGASILQHIVISGRYDAIPKVGPLDLAGFTVHAGVRVF
jgi:hypothetical protein